LDNFDTYIIQIFLPESALTKILDIASEAGAGRIGNYDHCASVTKVTGYWRPLAGSNPTIGREGEVSCEPEVKLEVDCDRDLVPIVVERIREIHPYEEPVIHILPVATPWFPTT
jgi:hypothetical protein